MLNSQITAKAQRREGKELFFAAWRLRCFLLVLSALSLQPSAFAQLTVRVTPGKTFRENERPTTATLNQLGKPTIEVFGTVGGTNVSLGTNSVLGSHLSDSVVDNITIEFNSDVPRAIRVKAYSIGTNVVSTNLAGAGLTGGGGLPLSVLYDTNVFTVDTNNALTWQTNVDLSLLALKLAESYIFIGDTNNHAKAIALDGNVFEVNTNVDTNGVLTLRDNLLNGFTSFEYPISLGLIVATNHGVGTIPKLFNVVLVCQTNEFGWVAGDEISTVNLGDGSFNGPIFNSAATATQVLLFCHNNANAMRWFNKTTGAAVTLTRPRWKIKAYARP